MIRTNSKGLTRITGDHTTDKHIYLNDFAIAIRMKNSHVLYSNLLHSEYSLYTSILKEIKIYLDQKQTKQNKITKLI